MIDLDRMAATASAWAPLAVLVLACSVGAVFGLPLALLVVAAGVLVLAISMFWSSLGRLTGESPLTLEEAVGLGAPSHEEERKRSIMRALKDLSFERSVGKISETDFAELSERYRAEAKDLMRAIEEDTAPRREKAEAALAARLAADAAKPAGKRGKSGKSRPGKALRADPKMVDTVDETPAPKDAPEGETDASAAELAGSEVSGDDEETVAAAATDASALVCPSCQTKNDVDARFCKRCGATLNAGEGASS
jgi:ribosomal protein L40E